MSGQAQVWAAFRDSVSRGLAEHPERSIEFLSQEYTAERIREAKATLKLAAILTPDEPEPEVIPEEPGKPSCSWCGATSEPLTDQYPRPPKAETIVKVVASHGIPEPVGTRHEHEPAHVENTGDTHCQDEDACQKRRDHHLPRWRLEQNRAARAAQAKVFEAEWQRDKWQHMGIPNGYQGHPIEHAAFAAEVILTGYEVVSQEVSAWIRLTTELDQRADEYLELNGQDEDDELALTAAAPPLSPPFDHWSHTIRGNPERHRAHLIGHQLAHRPGVMSAPDVLAAQDAMPVGGGQSANAQGPKPNPAPKQRKGKPKRSRGYARLNTAWLYNKPASNRARYKPGGYAGGAGSNGGD